MSGNNRSALLWRSSISIATLFVALSFGHALAQDPTAEPDKSQMKLRGDVMKWLREKSIPAGQEEAFDKFFNTYALLELPAANASLENDKSVDFSKIHTNLRNYFLGGKNGGAPRDKLNSLALAMMRKTISTTQFKLAVKYNAMLVIAELNENEAQGKKPLPAALPVMLKVLEAPRPKLVAQAQELEALRLGALIGIKRHVDARELGPIPPERLAEISKSMLKIVTQRQLLPGATADGLNWMQGLAAQTLGLLGDAGAGGAIAKALDDGLKNTEARLSTRREMAKALGQLKYPAGAKLDYSAFSADLGYLLTDVIKAEEARAAKFEQPISRRDLRAGVLAVDQALTGGPPERKGGLLAAAGTTPHKKFIESLMAKVQEVLKTCDSSEVDPDALINAIAEIEKLLPPRQAVAATPAPPAAAVNDGTEVRRPVAPRATKAADTRAGDSTVSP